MLDHDLFVTAQQPDHGPVYVLLHGRGADKDDLRGLGRGLPPGTVVLPRAPFAAAPWGYGSGWAWYQFLGGDQPEPDSFAASLDGLHELLNSLRHDLAGQRPLVLGGFSQGGTLSLGYALSHADGPEAVINFSGFLPAHPRVRLDADAVRGTRFFWGHGESDPAIPFALARSGRERLLAAGADLLACDYPIGHAIAPTELQDVAQWIRGWMQ